MIIALTCLVAIVSCSNTVRYWSDSPSHKRLCIEIEEFDCTSNQIHFPTNDYSSINPEPEPFNLALLGNRHFDMSEIEAFLSFYQSENIPSIDGSQLTQDSFQLVGPSEESLIIESNLQTKFCLDKFEKMLNAFKNELPKLNNLEQSILVTTEAQQSNSSNINSDLKQDSSHSAPPAQNETIISYSKKGLPIVSCSHGILSWSENEIKYKLLCTSFHLKKLSPLILYYGTDRYENFFSFRYATNSFRLLTKDTSSSPKEEFALKFITIVPAIIRTVPLSNPYSISSYYLYRDRKIYSKRMQNSRRVPLYFLFTSISHFLMKTGESDKEILRPLIKDSFRRATIANLFKLGKWNFLKKYLKETFGIDEIKMGRRESDYVRFDISTVSFIHDEMRNGGNEKTKILFKQVWEACKGDRRGKVVTELSSNPKLIVPHSAECGLNPFEEAARKLYQLKFTDLLFTNWNSIDDLLEEFKKLKSDFDLILIDFRLRVFSRNDFELLRNSLECIKLLSIDERAVDFFIELEYFITFKCFIFAYDFCSHITESSISNEKTFENIKAIHESFEEIRSSFLQKEIQLPPLNYNLIEPNTNNSFSLKALIDNFPILHTTDSFYTVIADKLSIFLNEFQYCKIELGFFKEIPRFIYFSFITEVEELITGNNSDDEIEKMFLNEKYNVFWELWSNPSVQTFHLSVEGKKEFLNHFKIFLSLYNQ